MNKFCKLVLLGTAISLVGCSDVPSPEEDALVSNLGSIDQMLIEARRTALFAEAEIIDIEHVGGESVAVATIRISSTGVDSDSKFTDIRLVLVHTDSGWEVFDKDLKNPGSSTSMIVRGAE